MKILPVESIREADKYTIQNEPIKSIDLMERAAKGCVEWIVKHLPLSSNFTIICGTGNNGGDGLAIARLLHQMSIKCSVYIIKTSNNQSEDFLVNLNRLTDFDFNIQFIKNETDIPILNSSSIIIDSIFGSGLSKSVTGIYAQVISIINNSNAFVISIDIPSGLPADCACFSKSEVVRANITLSFEMPKLAFMFPQNSQFVGEWNIIPIQLHSEFLDKVNSKNILITKNIIQSIYKVRSKFSHKGTFGHALIIAGSTGKYGAAILSAEACLRAGTGLLTVHTAQKGLPILQTAIPEAMVSIDETEDYIGNLPGIQEYDAIAIGPGIGTQKATQNQLKLLIQNSNQPLIFDADALNIISENKTWLSFIPPNSILTPHPGEFARLFGKVIDDFEKNKIQRDLSFKYKIFIILKGAHTAITTPNGECFFNSTGNPGMATAGSGDVLTGILLSLLSQGYTPKETAILGVYLHGLAGDFASEKFSQESMIARDIIRNLAPAFQAINK